MTPAERATAATWLDLCTQVAGRPVVSHASGTHWHIVFTAHQDDDDQLHNLPWCRRPTRQAKRRRNGVGPGHHNQWHEAGLRQLVDLPPCGDCRRHTARLMEWEHTP